MSPTQIAFYQSLEEMRNSYAVDLQMIINYHKAVEADLSRAGIEHLQLLEDQLRLVIDNIEEIIKMH